MSIATTICPRAAKPRQIARWRAVFARATLAIASHAAIVMLLWACRSAPPPPAASPTSPSRAITSADASADDELHNAFSEDERASGVTNATLLSCMAELQAAENVSGKASELHVKAWYCVCMTDAFGIAKKPTVDVDRAGGTCMDFALSSNSGTAEDTRTPYTGASFLSAGQIAGSLQGCVKRTREDPKTDKLTAREQESFCSCLVDSMRAARSASTDMSIEVTRSCASKAGWEW